MNYNDDALESKVERDAAAFATLRGWWEAKFVSPSLRGVPDRILIREGRVIFIEFKKLGKEPNKQQLKRHKEIREHGIEVFVVDAIEEAREILK